MRQVKSFVLVLIFLFGPAAFSQEEEDNYCGLLLDYLGLQETHFSLKQRNLPIPPELLRRLVILKKQVFESAAAATPNEESDSDSFEPYVEWTPSQDSGDWSPERDHEVSEEKPNPAEAKYFSLDVQLSRLEEYLTEHEGGDAHARVDSVFRRMAVEKTYQSGRYKKELEQHSVLSPSQQLLVLELWLHDLSRHYTSEPEIAEISRFANVVNLPTDEALKQLSALDFSTHPWAHGQSGNTLAEIIDNLAVSRVSLTPSKLRNQLIDFQRSGHPYPTESFGKLLHYYLGTRDDLALIHDVASLDKYLSTHHD